MFAEGNRVTVLARECPVDEFTGKTTNGKCKTVSFFGWSVIEVLRAITNELDK
jgi:hypothetical protein